MCNLPFIRHKSEKYNKKLKFTKVNMHSISGLTTISEQLLIKALKTKSRSEEKKGANKALFDTLFFISTYSLL